LRLLEHRQPGQVDADEYRVKHTVPNASKKSVSMPTPSRLSLPLMMRSPVLTSGLTARQRSRGIVP
jgi:hypothetical protein